MENNKENMAPEEQEKYELELMLANQQEQEAHLEEILADLHITSDNYDSEIAYAYELADEYAQLLNEQNALIQAAKLGVSVDGATLYCTHQPCVICAKLIVNAGIKRVVYQEGYPDEFAMSIFEQAGIIPEKYEEHAEE